MVNRDQFYGAIEQYSETDYLAGGELVIPEAPYRFSDLKHQYNQNEVGKMSCTIHGAMGAVTDITHHIFSLEERQELWRLAKEQGASDTTGWYIGKACDLVRRYWNEKNPTNKLYYYRIKLSEFNTILPKGYSLVAGYKGNANYNQDVNDDGVLDNTMFGASTYGHCNRIIADQGESAIDNFFGKKWNIYRIADLDQLIENKVFFDEAYFFVTQQSMEHLSNLPIISDWARDAVEWCRKKGFATKWDNPQQIIADATAEKMWFNAGVLTTFTGQGISKERMAKILFKTLNK